MAKNKTMHKAKMHSEDNMDLINAESKRSITVIPALDELSFEEFQQQVDRLNQLMEKYEAFYIDDVMLSRIQRRGLIEIIRERIIQIINKGEKRESNR